MNWQDLECQTINPCICNSFYRHLFLINHYCCRVDKILQMYNRVNNFSDMGIFAKWAWIHSWRTEMETSQCLSSIMVANFKLYFQQMWCTLEQLDQGLYINSTKKSVQRFLRMWYSSDLWRKRASSNKIAKR